SRPRSLCCRKERRRITTTSSRGLALSNDGRPVPSRAGSLCGLIPKGAKNIPAAKDFLKYLIQPKVCNEYLKTGLGRRLPAMPVIAKDDPWWLDPKDPHRVAYTTQGPEAIVGEVANALSDPAAPHRGGQQGGPDIAPDVERDRPRADAG